MNGSRSFWFDRDVEFWSALATIRAALDDEALALSDANTPDRVRAFLMADGLRVVVPSSRIVNRPWPREETR